MSHIALTYHLILSTYRRENTILADYERQLYKYIYDFSMQRGVKIWRIGGMPDHVHILCDIPPKYSISDFVRLLKSETSKFMSVNQNFPAWRRWSEGYGIFSISVSDRISRMEYIMNQKSHHSKQAFVDEYKNLLHEAGFAYDVLPLGE